MARIRKIGIEHFRSIRSLAWHPGPGINCLIGPGDSGKSTILEWPPIPFTCRESELPQLRQEDF